MTIEYMPKGVCAQKMRIQVEDGKVQSVEIAGGCHGNAQGIIRLVENMEADEVIRRLEGIHCGFKKTSCPDQLAQALKKMQE